jgi:hypothetical protein
VVCKGGWQRAVTPGPQGGIETWYILFYGSWDQVISGATDRSEAFLESGQRVLVQS